MLVFFVLLCFAAEGFCYEEETSIAKPVKRLCPVNEISVKCRTICPPQSCNISYTTYTCGPETKKCEPGCDCIKNYLRDNNGNCILNDKCPPPKPECGENQVSSDCADDYSSVPSITLCQPGCRCIEGYARNTLNECVPNKPQCGKNQVPSDCADDYSSVPTITLCRPGCRCIEGYARNTLNECVPRTPVLDCPKNEQPSICKQTCPPQDCGWDPTKMACRPGPCQPGCNCIKGYLRDKKGKCIPKEKCPPILPECGKFEEPTDCAENIGKYDSTLTIKCRPCQCIQGYVRDSNGVCVRRIQCGLNEELSDCKKECPPDSCAWDPVLMDCKPVPCKLGCNCIKGYLRDDNGKCIPKKQCPARVNCLGAYQVWNSCPPPCYSENCGDKEVVPKVCNTFAPHQCEPRCVCQDNHRRDEYGNCIPIAECRPQCGKYEEQTDCSDDYSQLPYVDDPSASSARIRCFPGCKCIAGYQRDSKGGCVKIPRCGRNETYVPCDAGCPTQFCPKDDSLAIVACSQPFPCRGGCACKSNYKYRSYKDKTCIFARECPPIKCTRKDEVYNSCPSACFTDACGELDEETAACNTFVEPQCEPRCMCRPQYCRDSSGNCIPKEECPDQS